ncbi:MAG TPA: DnaD domain protein [Dehalococcoidales bacterium]|nr:DnaD domain protein [Dehalococcoidales bacterium]
MNKFKGFPSRMNFTPIPNLVFSNLAGEIADIAELKVLLHVFEALYPKKGSVRYISAVELSAHPSVRKDLNNISAELLGKYLDDLVNKNILLKMDVTGENNSFQIYFINNAENQAICERIKKSEINIEGIRPENLAPAAAAAEDIFTLFEENIGMITPLIAEELKEATKHYPEGWIKEAFKEAVSQNKRNWKYISRILERWATEGKKDGTRRGHIKKDTDPDKYVRGKYGHMVRR